MERVDNLVKKSGIPRNSIEFEFTETVLVENLTTVISKLNSLKEKGYRIAIDDYNDFLLAKTYADQIDETKINDDLFRVNFIYLRGLVLSYLNLDLNKVLDDFTSIEKEHPEITNDKNYVHNKNIIETILKKQSRDD